jgi:glycosyltransferase involved in cell wall biosynthesis
MDGLSIIITYYKGEKYIEKCIESIINSNFKNLDKSPFEIIIIFDSPSDSSIAENQIKTKYGDLIDITTIINKDNLGVSNSRNIGLEKIKYNYFTVIDQDDFVLENYFKEIFDNIKNNIPLLILNGVINKNNVNIPFYFFKPKFKFSNILFQNTVIYTPGQLVFNSKLIKQNNLFIETSNEYKGCDDWAAYLNILINKKINYKYIKKKVFSYNIHVDNFSHQKFIMINSSISVVNYFLKKPNLEIQKKNQLKLVLRLQNFYLQQKCYNRNPFYLFLKYPFEFIFHYIIAFTNLDRLNRFIIFFRMKFN